MDLAALSKQWSSRDDQPSNAEGGKVTVSNLEELAPGPHGQLGRPAACLLRVALEQQSD